MVMNKNVLSQRAAVQLVRGRHKYAKLEFALAFENRYDRTSLAEVDIKTFVHLIVRLKKGMLNYLIDQPQEIKAIIKMDFVENDFKTMWHRIFQQALCECPGWAFIFLHEISSCQLRDHMISHYSLARREGRSAKQVYHNAESLDRCFTIKDFSKVVPRCQATEASCPSPRPQTNLLPLCQSTEVSAPISADAEPGNSTCTGASRESKGFTTTMACNPPQGRFILDGSIIPQTIAEYRPTELDLSEAASYTTYPEAAQARQCHSTSGLDVAEAACFVTSDGIIQPGPAQGTEVRCWPLPMNEKNVTSDIACSFDVNGPDNTDAFSNRQRFPVNIGHGVAPYLNGY